jgi:hypothetical protein
VEYGHKTSICRQMIMEGPYGSRRLQEKAARVIPVATVASVHVTLEPKHRNCRHSSHANHGGLYGDHEY